MSAHEVRPLRCPHCGYAAPVDAVVRDVCPRCLSPLSGGVGADDDLAPSTRFESLKTVVEEWVDAFNARDLEGMIARMSADVAFHPLRLGRVEAGYHGHDGVRRWFAQLRKDDRPHRLEIAGFRRAGANRMIALGTLHVDPGADPAPFWALDRFRGDVIASAHHYLTDPDILEHRRLFEL